MKSDQELQRLAREYLGVDLKGPKGIQAGVDWMLARGLLQENSEGKISATDEGVIFGKMVLVNAGEAPRTAEIIHLPNPITSREIGAIFDEMDHAIRCNVADAIEKMDALGVPLDNIEALVADVMQAIVDKNFPQKRPAAPGGFNG